MAVKRFGRYEIIGEIGRGGMATVFQAHDTHFKRDVAIKVLPRELMHAPNFKARFEREAQTIATLDHPAIVAVYDFGEQDGQPYFVMRYMSGGSLASRIKKGPLSIDEIIHVVRRASSALGYAHSRGIVHRDLKPDNILFDQFGDCYLADFGVAHLSQSASALTASGTTIGTPEYMSPEQIRGGKQIDGRSDIYSLGIVLFETLTGQRPYEADNPTQVMMKHVLDPIPRILEHRPDLPSTMDAIITKALAKERSQRYANAAETAAAIIGGLESGSKSPPAPLPQLISRSSSIVWDTEKEGIAERILTEYPHPIARAFSFFHSETDSRLRCQQLILTFEFVLRYVSIISICQYLQCTDRPRSVDKYLARNLVRPSLGHWNGFLSGIVPFFGKSDIRLFTPELLNLYRTSRGERTAAAKAIDKLIRLRNDIQKSLTLSVLSEDEVEEIISEFEPEFFMLLKSVEFLTNYHLVRVNNSKAIVGEDSHRWEMRPLIGTRPQELEVQSVVQKCSPGKDRSLYLLDSRSGDVLCLSPLLIWHQANADLELIGLRKSEVLFYNGRARERPKYIGVELPRLLDDGFRDEVENLIEQLRGPITAKGDLFEQQHANSQKHLETQLRNLKRDKYRVQTYVDRHEFQGTVEDFIRSDKTGLIITGHAGMGKTNLLCHMAEKLGNDGHLVLFYDAGGSLTMDITKHLAADLFANEPNGILASLEILAELASRKGKCVIVMFDAVNEFHYGQFRAADLLVSIDDLISRNPSLNFKVLVSCRTETWNQLKAMKRTELHWDDYFKTAESQTIAIDKFSHEELEEAYGNYVSQWRLRTPFERLSAQAQERLRDPLLLRLAANAYKDKPLPKEVLGERVLRDYYREFVGIRNEDALFLDVFVGLLLHQRRDFLGLRDFGSDPVLREGTKDSQDAPYQRLKDNAILTETGSGPLLRVKFTYDRFFEYVLARHIQGSNSPDSLAPIITEMAATAWEYSSLWGSAKMLLLILGDERVFLDLARSSQYSVRELIVETLVALHDEDQTVVLGIAKHLLELESYSATQAALKAAYRIGLPAQSIFDAATGSKADSTRRLLVNYLYLLWQRDSQVGLDVLKNLVSSIPSAILDDLRSAMPKRSFRRGSNVLEVVTAFMLNVLYDHLLEPEVILGFSDLLKDLLKNRLQLPTKTKTQKGDSLRGNLGLRLFATLARKLIGRRITGAMLWSEFLPPQDVINACQLEPTKTDINTVLDRVRQGQELIVEEEVMARLLQSHWLFPNTIGIVALATQFRSHPESCSETIVSLFDRLSPTGRFWSILPFSLTLPYGLAEQRIQLLETITRRFIVENRDFFLEDPWGLHAKFDLPLIPLGLAYGQAGLSELPLYRNLLEAALNAGDLPLTDRFIRGLGALGIYYPSAVLDIYSLLPALSAPDSLFETLTASLARIATVHPEAVDLYCLRYEVDNNTRRAINAQVSPELVRPYTEWGAAYNAVVYAATRPEEFNPEFFRFVLTDMFYGVTICNSHEELTRTIFDGWLAMLQKYDYDMVRLVYS